MLPSARSSISSGVCGGVPFGGSELAIVSIVAPLLVLVTASGGTLLVGTNVEVAVFPGAEAFAAAGSANEGDEGDGGGFAVSFRIFATNSGTLKGEIAKQSSK